MASLVATWGQELWRKPSGTVLPKWSWYNEDMWTRWSYRLSNRSAAAARTWEVPSETEGLDFKFHFISTNSNFYIAGCGVVVPILGSVVVGLPRSLRREASWTQAAEEENEKGLRDPEERGGRGGGRKGVRLCRGGTEVKGQTAKSICLSWAIPVSRVFLKGSYRS